MSLDAVGRKARYTRACLALLQYHNLESAASAVGIGLRTLQHWMDDPDFQAMLHDAQDDAMELASMRLAGLSGCAISTLGGILDNAEAPPGVRARVADLTLANTLRYSESVSLAQRVKALERTQLPGSKDKVSDAETTSD